MREDFIDIKQINEEIKTDELKVIRDAESRFRGQLFDLANFILRKGDVKIVLIGGPSCAGKTTSANLLKDILQRKGKKVLTIAMDNFFKSQKDREVLEDGSIDFDSINIVNFKQMEECFGTLFKKSKAKFPEFDFVSGINYENKIDYVLTDETIIIFEGIHVLNPQLISHLKTDKFIRVFISNFSGFCYDELSISPREFRLVRRMVRDMARRGVNPPQTLKMWNNICKAEDEYITPFKDKVDFQVNTTHQYEMGLYKDIILKAVYNKELSIERLGWLKLFEYANSVNIDLLPDTTLMNEFIKID